MTKSVIGHFGNAVHLTKDEVSEKFNSNMEAVQVYPTTSFLDLPKMTDKEWQSMTKEQQDYQLDYEANLVKACENLFAESSVK